MRSKSPALLIARGAVVAALYTVLSYLTQSMQIAFFQIRPAEALCVLPLFMPEAVGGLFIGCIISNLICGCLPLDVVFGSLATLIGALCAFWLSRLPRKYKWCATIPTILSNAAIIPPILIFEYGSTDAYFFLLLTVFVGELISAGILGSLLYYALERTRLFRS